MTRELVELPDYYAAPGFVLLARGADQTVGCVGVRALEPSTGEIRRLFVRPEHRCAGAGRRLLDEASGLAEARGFDRLVLNTLPTMSAARALYDIDGFIPIEPYVEDPVAGVEFLGRDLGGTGRG